jgi:ABC-type antimicrobial peptide transport system permease subunit
LVTLAFFLLFVWSMSRMTVAFDSKRQALMHRIDRFDLLLQLASLAGFAAITLFALWRF